MSYVSPQRDLLEKAQQSGTWLEGQEVQRGEMDGLELPQAQWKDVVIRRCNLNGANLSEAQLLDVDLANTGFRGAQFSGAWFDAVRLTLCDLAQLNLSGATLRDVTFEESPMPFADLNSALLSGVNFRVVDLQSGNFQGAALLHSRFRDERLGGANLMATDFRNAIILDCDFSEANLQGADFSGALILSADMRAANLEGANFSGAIGFEVQGVSSDLQQVSNAREAHWLLHEKVSKKGVHARLALEIAWSSLIEGTRSIQGGRDVASQLLRQRNLSFADLIRFIKERFGHAELQKLIVDGDQVGVRTDGGMVPLTTYSGGTRMGTPSVQPTSVPNPGATGMAAFSRGGSSRGARSADSNEPAAPASAAPTPRSGPNSPPPPGVPTPGRRRAEPEQDPTEDMDVFADSRFGLIDLDDEAF